MSDNSHHAINMVVCALHRRGQHRSDRIIEDQVEAVEEVIEMLRITTIKTRCQPGLVAPLPIDHDGLSVVAGAEISTRHAPTDLPGS